MSLEQVVLELNELKNAHRDLLERCKRGALAERDVSTHFDAQRESIASLLKEGTRAFEVYTQHKPTWRAEPKPGRFTTCESLTKHLAVLDLIIAEVERNMPGGAEFPGPRAYFLETPIYHRFPFQRSDAKAILRIEFFDRALDAYCTQCSADSVFKSEVELPGVGSRYGGARPDTVEALVSEFSTAFFEVNGFARTEMSFGDYVAMERTFTNRFVCSRDSQHDLVFISRVTDGELLKIGQYPSLADLEATRLAKYRKVLGSQYTELTMAVGLAAHGVGVGSFVYLRRIFERQIAAAYAEAKKEPTWPSDDEWDRKRVVEKIPLLSAYLPEFVVQNANVYGILSKAIHSLSEEECKQHFKPVLLAIEMVLDQELERREKAAKVAAAQNAIAKVRQQIGGTGK